MKTRPAWQYDPVWPHGQDPAEKFGRAANTSMAALTSVGSCSRSLAKQSAFAPDPHSQRAEDDKGHGTEP